MDDLTHGERAYCVAIADRIMRLRKLLDDAELCEPPDARRWFTYLATMKSVQRNVHIDLSFVATLLAKAWLSQRFPILAFDAAAKAQGANGLDVDLKTTVGSRIVAEIKNTVPYGANDFGAAQKREFAKDFGKLNAVVADHKFLFVTNPRAFTLLRGKYSQQIPGVEIVLLEAEDAS